MDAPESTEETAPKGSRRLSGTVNWGTATVIGIFAGLLYGGSKEAAASVSKDAELMLKLGSTPDKREQYRLMRDAMEKRFIRVTRGSIIGGVRLGMFTATFYGLQNFLAEQRGVHDVYNIAAAGSATAAMFGLILPGSLMWRARNVLLGSTLGAAFGFPLVAPATALPPRTQGSNLGRPQPPPPPHLASTLPLAADFDYYGWAHLKLVEKANEESPTSNSLQNVNGKEAAKSGVGAAIERLEGSLRK